MKGFEQFYTDIYAVLTGILGALIKGIRNKLGIKITFISMITGAFLCYATVGIIESWFTNLPPKITVAISFFIGFVAHTITDMMDDFIKDLYDICLNKFKSLNISKKKKDEDVH